MSDTLDPSAERAIDRLTNPLGAAEYRELRAFCNALRIIRHLDFDALIEAGAIDDRAEFRRFDDDAMRWIMRAPDHKTEALWRLVREQQPVHLRATAPRSEAAE